MDATRCGSLHTLCGLVFLSCSKEAIQTSRPHRVPLRLHHLHITITIHSVHHARSCRSLLALSLADYALACLYCLALAKIAPESRYQSAATSQAPSPFSSNISRDAQSPWQSWDQALRVLIPKEDISRAIMISNTPRFATEEDFKLLLEEYEFIPWVFSKQSSQDPYEIGPRQHLINLQRTYSHDVQPYEQ
jgi:hypothetical protein